jgi:uridine kinase
MSEQEIFQQIEFNINEIQNQKITPIRIAINGVEGTGKTVFAEKLNAFLNSKKNISYHISIDGFHNLREIRHKQGSDSAVGYYEDAYNEDVFVNQVLISSQNNPPTILEKYHDLETDLILDNSPIIIQSNSIIISDGAYLFKPIYLPHWDLKLYLKTDFEIAMQRGVQRDKELLGGIENAYIKYLHRYHLASKIYIDNYDPISKADMVIDNTDFNNLIFQLPRV